MKNLDLYLADIVADTDRLVCISFVCNPATQRTLSVISDSDDKMIIVTPIIVANDLIFRNDKEMGNRNIIFLPETIKQIVEKATKERTIYKYDYEHNGKSVENITLIESFIIDYAMGIKGYKGLSGLNDGSWVGKFVITNKNIINDIRNNKINGVSISAYITEEKIELTDAIEIYNKLKTR